MGWCKYWPFPTIAANLLIGWKGFESLQVFQEIRPEKALSPSEIFQANEEVRRQANALLKETTS